MVSPTFYLGPFSIHFYTIFFVFAVLLSYLLIRRTAAKFQIKVNDIDNLLIIIVPLGIIGARLYHVIDKWSYYQNHFNQIFYLWQGGLGIFGGLGAALIGAWFYCRIKKIDLLNLLDLTSVYLLLGQGIGRFGNYFNQEGFGPPTDLPWKVFIFPDNRPPQFKSFEYFHPAFFYEAAVDLIGFLFLVWLLKKEPKKGVLLGACLIIYGFGRLLAEIFRLDTAKFGEIKAGYLICLVLILTGLFLIGRFTTMVSSDKKP